VTMPETLGRYSEDPRPIAAKRLRARDLGSLDCEIYEATGSYTTDSLARRVGWIAASVEHHLANSEVYRRVAHAREFDLARLRETGDLSLVPVISSGTFKRRRVESITGASVKDCTSSGTSGSTSIVPRDSATLERYAGTILHGTREMIGQLERRRAFVLGPTIEEAGDLWFSYALSLAQLLHDTDYFVRNGVFDPRGLHRALRELEDEIESPVLVAPPALLLELVSWMEREGERLDLQGREFYSLTAGGWKRRASEMVSRDDLTAKVADRLGIAPERQRDLFNMVELNTVIFECEHHRKHIPSWLEIIVRRPANLSVASSGEEGILTYLDPTPLSYPGFIMSDDFGSVGSAPCPCGRGGRTMKVHRRLASIEERGCGLKMDRYSRSATE
jgi:long-chain-fatty-acid---luciferin-component ligase